MGSLLSTAVFTIHAGTSIAISNVIYYLGDVCSRCVSDEKALLSKVLPPGM